MIYYYYYYLADNAACHREAIAVQLACGDLRCPHGSLSLCDVLQYHRPYYQLWGYCKSLILIFENFLWFNDFSGHTDRKSEVKKTFTYLLNGFSVHCLCHSYLCINGFTFFDYSI